MGFELRTSDTKVLHSTSRPACSSRNSQPGHTKPHTETYRNRECFNKQAKNFKKFTAINQYPPCPWRERPIHQSNWTQHTEQREPWPDPWWSPSCQCPLVPLGLRWDAGGKLLLECGNICPSEAWSPAGRCYLGTRRSSGLSHWRFGPACRPPSSTW